MFPKCVECHEGTLGKPTKRAMWGGEGARIHTDIQDYIQNGTEYVFCLSHQKNHVTAVSAMKDRCYYDHSGLGQQVPQIQSRENAMFS